MSETKRTETVENIWSGPDAAPSNIIRKAPRHLTASVHVPGQVPGSSTGGADLEVRVLLSIAVRTVFVPLQDVVVQHLAEVEGIARRGRIRTVKIAADSNGRVHVREDENIRAQSQDCVRVGGLSEDQIARLGVVNSEVLQGVQATQVVPKVEVQSDDYSLGVEKLACKWARILFVCLIGFEFPILMFKTWDVFVSRF